MYYAYRTAEGAKAPLLGVEGLVLEVLLVGISLCLQFSTPE